MVEFMKKVSSRAALTVGVSILFSGVTACVVWFLGNVLGISALAIPFTLVWRYALIAFVAVSACAQTISALTLIVRVEYLARKWAPTPKSDIWEGVREYNLLKQKGFKDWDTNRFRNWLATRQALKGLKGSLIRSMGGNIKVEF